MDTLHRGWLPADAHHPRAAPRTRQPVVVVGVECRGGSQHGDRGVGMRSRPVGEEALDLRLLGRVRERRVGAEGRLFGERHRVVGPRAVHHRARHEHERPDSHRAGGVEQPAGAREVDPGQELLVARRSEHPRQMDDGVGAGDHRCQIGRREIEPKHQLAMRAYAFINFHDAFVQQYRQHDMRLPRFAGLHRPTENRRRQSELGRSEH